MYGMGLQPKASTVGAKQLGSAESVASGDVSEPYKRMHECDLPRTVEFQSRNPLAIGQDGGRCQLPQLSTVQEGLQYVLLNIQIVVVDGSEPLAQLGQVLDRLLDAVIVDIIGSGFGSQQQVIAHLLFDEAVALMAADHRVGKMDIFDHGLQFAAIWPGDLSAEDDGNFVGLADGSVGIQ